MVTVLGLLDTVMMKALRSFKTSETIHPKTQHHILQGLDLHQHHYENTESPSCYNVVILSYYVQVWGSPHGKWL